MKKLFVFLIPILLFTCTKDDVLFDILDTPLELRAKKGKIDICHYDIENDTWHMININEHALEAHMNHGDVVPDFDQDGFTKVNPCGIGSQDDCNDENSAIHPDAMEICSADGVGIDEDCDSLIDCEDPDCDEAEECIHCDPDCQICAFIDHYDFNASDMYDSYFEVHWDKDHPYCGQHILFQARMSDYQKQPYHSGNIEASAYYCARFNRYSGVVQFGYVNPDEGIHFSRSYPVTNKAEYDIALLCYEQINLIAKRAGFEIPE
jgi:hypothetical protein